MMVLITASSSNEDSPGTQLRVNKKLTSVCSGKRSRFSKPRPNILLSKRGELNSPAGACKASKNSEEVVETCHVAPVTNVDKQRAENILINSPDKTIKRLVKEDIQIISHEKHDQKINEDNLKFTSCEDTIKKTIEDDVRIISEADVEKLVVEQGEVVISSTNSEEAVSKKKIQITSSTNTEVFDLESCIQDFSDSNAKKPSLDEDIQSISSKDVEKSVSKEDIAIMSSTVANKTSKENDIQTRPPKISGSSLKVLESEKRGASIATPTVIDKSKYPHLTSILSKKRTEPRKEVQQKRRKKFKKYAPPERSKLTMADLIYWNPAKTEQSQKNAVIMDETPSDNVTVEEECVDDVNESENNIQDSVPKLVISEDGQINIDQSSLFVSRNVSQPISTEVVRKDDTTYSSFRKRPLTKHWTAKDTANFYRALSLVGADFSLMEQIFPNRTRRELKQKFKREEKFNIDLVNKVLYESQTFDELTLNDFMDQNSLPDDSTVMNGKEDNQTAKKEKSRKQKTYKKAKSIDDEICDASINHLEEETENEKSQNNKGRKKKTKKITDDDDDDVDISVTDYINYNSTDDKGSKRKRYVKKLPDDFIDLDSIVDLEIWPDYETNNNDDFEETNSSENQENSNVAELDNDVEEIPSENACTILSKIINGADNTDILQNLKEENSQVTVTLPFATNDNEEYISVEYIKNDSGADLAMLGNVMAYEVVNTQTPVTKKKRKINSFSPAKSREIFLATKISPTNYTNYTPV